MINKSTRQKNENFSVFVVRTIDDFVEKTFETGVIDFVFVPISEAKRYIGKRKDCYLATEDRSIAKDYSLKLINQEYN